MPPNVEFSPTAIAGPLGGLWLAFAAVNFAIGVAAWRRGRIERIVPVAIAGLFAALAVAAFCGHAVGLPEWLKRFVDATATPITVTVKAYVLFAVVFIWRRFFLRPAVAWSVLNLALAWLGLSLADAQFAAVVTTPDTLPIVAMVFLLGFFIWLGGRQAEQNDARTAAGQPPLEKLDEEKVLTWPDLVYIELIAAVGATALLLAWSVLVRAPLEPPANPAVTPNPSKAPWYFLGLQELLVFADAWWIGVVVPVLCIVGLSAIPYLDRDTQGSGHYSIRGRRFAWAVFLGGFLLLWILPILIGTFMRGPNWSFFGPYEARDPQRITAESTERFSTVFWHGLLRSEPPQPSPDAGVAERLGVVLLRELPGLAGMAIYLFGIPWLLARGGLHWARQRLGFSRYWLMALLLMLMLSLPLKMFLRWTVGLSYIVSMPECGLNF